MLAEGFAGGSLTRCESLVPAVSAGVNSSSLNPGEASHYDCDREAHLYLLLNRRL